MKLPEIIHNASHSRRWMTIVEGVLLVGLVTFWDIGRTPSGVGFRDWPVTPYMIVVLLMASRYGCLSGLIAALAAEIGRTSVAAAQAGGFEAIRLVGPAWHSDLLAAVVIALVAGTFTDRLKGFLRRVIAAHDEEEIRLERLSKEYTLLADEKNLLDKQVLGTDETFEAVVSLFDKLDRYSPRQLPGQILLLVTKILGGGSAALYRVRRGSPQPSASSVSSPIAVPIATDRTNAKSGSAGSSSFSVGPSATAIPSQRDNGPEADPSPSGRDSIARGAAILVNGQGEDWDRALPLDHPLIAHALRKNGVVTIAEVEGWSKISTLSRESVHVACRLDARWSGARLLLLVRDLPFASFSPSRLQAVAVALRVVSRAFTRAQMLRRLRIGSRDAALSRMSSRTYFSKRLEEEMAIGDRQGHSVSLIKARVRTSKGSSVARRSRLRKALAEAVLRMVRVGDLIAHAGGVGTFTILCPVASSIDPAQVGRHLESVIEKRLGRHAPLQAGEIEVSTLGLSPGVEDQSRSVQGAEDKEPIQG